MFDVYFLSLILEFINFLTVFYYPTNILVGLIPTF